MAMTVLLKLSVLLVCHLCLAHAQTSDCDEVDGQLSAILEACRQGTRECLASQNLDGLGTLFCEPEAEIQFMTFLDCTNATYSDQIFSTLCSGPSCSRPAADCTSDDLCTALVPENPGLTVMESCCSGNTFGESIETCPTNCSLALEELVDDLSCCANSAPYVYFFSTCSANLRLETIDELYSVCNVTLPDPCRHTFSERAGSGAVRSLLWVVGLAVLLAVYVLSA